MKRKEAMYRINLEDCSAASFTSLSKPYYGSLDEIRELLSTIRDDPQMQGCCTEVLNAFFNLYEKGRRGVMHLVAYKEVPLLERVQIFGKREFTLSDYSWEHINTWGYPYKMRCKSAVVSQFWVSRKGEFSRCFKVLFDGLEYESFDGWKTVGHMLWGYPHMLEYEAPLIYNRLMIEDATFASLNAAMADLELPEPSFDFSGFCNDIFGDG